MKLKEGLFGKMKKITKFYPTDAAKDPDNVLEQAIGEYTDLLIIGWDKEDMFSARSNLGLDKSDLLFLIETFKTKLMNGNYDD